MDGPDSHIRVRVACEKCRKRKRKVKRPGVSLSPLMSSNLIIREYSSAMDCNPPAPGVLPETSNVSIF